MTDNPSESLKADQRTFLRTGASSGYLTRSPDANSGHPGTTPDPALVHLTTHKASPTLPTHPNNISQPRLLYITTTVTGTVFI